MKVGIATVQVPFTTGGAELLADGLCAQIKKKGHEAEVISMPFKWYPPSCIINEMEASRLLDVTEVNGSPIDLLITLKFPAYFFQHSNKVMWMLHQHRQAYDLYGTQHGDLHTTLEGIKVSKLIKQWDDQYIPEHKSLFTISNTVSKRLSHYNNLISEPLYPPPFNDELFHCNSWENFILAPGRIDSLKRQALIIEAMTEVPNFVKLILIGNDQGKYANFCKKRVEELGLNSRVIFMGLVNEEQKVDLYSRATAVYNGVLDEDFGYVTIESFLSGKPVVTHSDSGGPLEFVISGENGFVTEPSPNAIAHSFRKIFETPNFACEMGKNGYNRIKEKNITWTRVIERLLS
jgi:glycosyltransferase involved in cell wall biosynthesis